MKYGQMDWTVANNVEYMNGKCLTIISDVQIETVWNILQISHELELCSSVQLMKMTCMS